MTGLLAMVLAIAWGGGPTGESFGPTETLLFFGDSITQGGAYITYTETNLRLAFPKTAWRVINAGVSSETVSGTSEPDHHPPRPNAHDRFERDVAAHRPSIVVACFGMNDGNYFPFDADRFAKYQQGIAKLRQRVSALGPVKLVLMTPPPYDATRRRNDRPDAKHHGYQFPDVRYDDTLRKYADWLVSLRAQGQTVVDDHAMVNRHLAERRRTWASFHVAPDAVHPNPTGHWLMSLALLREWSIATVPPTLVTLTSTGPKRWEWTGHLTHPWPIDPAWEAESVRLERELGGVGPQHVVRAMVPPGRYQLRLAEQYLGEYTAPQLANGVTVSWLPNYPLRWEANRVLELVRDRRAALDPAYRQQVREPGREAATLLRELEAKLPTDRLKPPPAKPWTFRLDPVGR
jgi:lysophospholipase L1-like esterase